MGQVQCARAPQEPAVVDIDPDGDLLLKVGVTRCIPSDANPGTEKRVERSGDESEEDSGDEPGDYSEEAFEDAAGDGLEDTTQVEPAEDTVEGPGEETEETAEMQEAPGAEVAEEPQNDDEEHDHAVAVTYRVCSRTLARSSPVWKKMLFGGFAESMPKDGDWIVELPDDDAQAFGFFLNTIHARFDKLPPFDQEPNLEWLYRVTVTADKYDIIRLLRPWAPTWAKHIGDKLKGWSEDSVILRQFVWISWVLGATREFTRAIRYMAMRYDDEQLGQIGAPTSDILEPANILGIVENLRLAFLKNILSPFQDALDKLTVRGTNHQYTCKLGQSGCEEVMLGKLIRSLNSQNLWPIPKAEDLMDSVDTMVEALKTVDRCTVRPVHRELAASDPVCHCEKVLRKPLSRGGVRGLFSVKLTQCHKTQLREHGMATGLATTSEEPARKKVKLSN